MLQMSAQCHERRFGYCTNAKTCFNVHFRAILAERCVLLGYLPSILHRFQVTADYMPNFFSFSLEIGGAVQFNALAGGDPPRISP